jgi:hypothetical protein
MSIIPEQQLREKAYNDCSQQMTKLVTKAELRFEPKESSIRWDPFIHRHLFKESFTIWREFDDIEVKVGPGGEILSFYDKNRFALRGVLPDGLLSDNEIIHAASTTGLLGPKAWVDQKVLGPAGIVMAIVRQSVPWFNQSVRFAINMTTKQVAAFQVIEGKKL